MKVNCLNFIFLLKKDGKLEKYDNARTGGNT